MLWILLASFSYFLGALTVILDKYLLGAQKIASPATYAFYVGLTGLGVLLFVPLGFLNSAFKLSLPSNWQLFLSLMAGLFFMAGITLLYFAIKRSQASKVTPVVFSVAPLVTFIVASFLGMEELTKMSVFGVVLLVLGGLLISFDLPLKLKKRKFFAGFWLSLYAGSFLGVAYVLFKYVYVEQNFFNGFVWTRAGAFLGVLLFFLVPQWRKSILQSFKGAKKAKKENLRTGGLFVCNKLIGGTSSVLFNMAIGLGSATLVSSMISMQYVFVLLLAVLAGQKMPDVFEERMHFWDWAQKVIAIVIIAMGMWFIS